MIFFQSGVTPNLVLSSGALLNTSPDVILGNFGVFTNIMDGLTSELRTNLNAAVTGNSGVINGTGIRLAANSAGAALGNVEIAYVIYRTGADSTAVQSRIVTWLGGICGILL